MTHPASELLKVAGGKCICPGRPGSPPLTCPAKATQEDGLCDECRAIDCPSHPRAGSLFITIGGEAETISFSGRNGGSGGSGRIEFFDG